MALTKSICPNLDLLKQKIQYYPALSKKRK